MRIEMIPGVDANGDASWRWRTVHDNGNIGVWSEHYRNKVDCRASIDAHSRQLRWAKIEEIV